MSRNDVDMYEALGYKSDGEDDASLDEIFLFVILCMESFWDRVKATPATNNEIEQMYETSMIINLLDVVEKVMMLLHIRTANKPGTARH
jgi:hypothetical protein